MNSQKTTRTKEPAEVITFKVDAHLSKAIRGVRNRSEFIRTALLQALDNSCPFCGGAGVLSAAQKTHWTAFLKHHEMRECKTCHGAHPVCKTVPSNRKPRNAP